MSVIAAKKLGAATVLMISTLGCSLVPAPQTPDTVQAVTTMESFDSAPVVEQTTEPSQNWWQRMGGDELGLLVEILREDSLLLTESRLQAKQAAELAIQAGSRQLPSIAYWTDVLRSRNPDPSGTPTWRNTYSTGLNIDLEADVYRKLHAMTRSAELSSVAASLSFRATEQLEIARLARNWVSATTLKRRLDLAAETASSFQVTYELTSRRHRAGSQSTSASDVLIARQNFESSRVDIPDIDSQFNGQLLAIDEQLARLPGESRRLFTGVVQPRTSAEAFIGTPSSLLANRPDVAAAELRYRAALHDVGAARANLYPAVSLTAALTFQGDTPGEYSLDDYITSLITSVTGALFQGGRLRSQVRLERAEAEELATSFARTALGAVIDVETALTQLSGLTEQLARASTAAETSRRSNELVQNRYRQGLTSILAVLETQRSLNNAQLNVILIEQALMNAEIDLYLSLGGDWTGTPTD